MQNFLCEEMLESQLQTVTQCQVSGILCTFFTRNCEICLRRSLWFKGMSSTVSAKPALCLRTWSTCMTLASVLRGGRLKFYFKQGEVWFIQGHQNGAWTGFLRDIL